MGKSAGPMPDYQGAVQQTADASQGAVNAQTGANRPSQNTPFAFSNWTQGQNGQWTQNSGFAGGLGQAAAGLQGQVGGLAKPMDWSQFGSLGTGDQARDQAINAAYGQATSRLDPMFAAREQSLNTGLGNAGLDPNSQAARNARRGFGQERNDAYTGALNMAIGQGTSAGNAVFNQNLASRQQAIAEALKGRSQPLEDLKGLQGFLAQPGFNGAGQASPADYFKAKVASGQWSQADADRQQQFWADLMGGAGQAGSSIASMLPLLLMA